MIRAFRIFAVMLSAAVAPGAVAYSAVAYSALAYSALAYSAVAHSVVTPRLAAQATNAETNPVAQRVADVEAVYQALAKQREDLGLSALARSPELERAAQAQVLDSVERGYFAFTGPDGKGLEHWVRAAGYQLGEGAEKLAEANLRVVEIIERWPSDQARNASSVFHPRMMDVGVGIARLGERNRIIVILGVTDDDLVRSRAAALSDADRIEAEFELHFNQLRAQAGLKPMKRHPALRRAAAELVAEILHDRLEPDERRRAYSMASRVRRSGYRMREALELQAVGPTSVEELVDFWFSDAQSQGVLLRRFLVEFGLSVAIGETADGPTVVWVLSVARPGSV